MEERRLKGSRGRRAVEEPGFSRASNSGKRPGFSPCGTLGKEKII
jgi:hypothetical protein